MDSIPSLGNQDPVCYMVWTKKWKNNFASFSTPCLQVLFVHLPIIYFMPTLQTPVDSIQCQWGSQGSGECPAGWMDHSQNCNWDDWHFHSCACLEWIFYSHSVPDIKCFLPCILQTSWITTHIGILKRLWKLKQCGGKIACFTEGEILLMARCNLFTVLWSCVFWGVSEIYEIFLYHSSHWSLKIPLQTSVT